MKGASLLILAGWFLVINYGATYPRDGSSIDLGQAYGFGGPSFETKAECELEGKRFVRKFYAEAKMRREKVARPTTFTCRQKEKLK